MTENAGNAPRNLTERVENSAGNRASAPRYPALCSECFRAIDLNACGRAIRSGTEYLCGCGRRLVWAAQDKWWEKDRGC